MFETLFAPYETGAAVTMYVFWTVTVLAVLGMLSHPVAVTRAALGIAMALVTLGFRLATILVAFALWGITRLRNRAQPPRQASTAAPPRVVIPRERRVEGPRRLPRRP